MNEEQYEIIRRGVVEWNSWKRHNRNVVDLSGADLGGADLNGADLGGANLNGAGLNGAGLNGADLREAHLSRANLREANLTRTDLSRANLSRANLNGTDLREANLSRANLTGANLTGTHVTNAILIGTFADGATVWPGGFNPERFGVKILGEETGGLVRLDVLADEDVAEATVATEQLIGDLSAAALEDESLDPDHAEAIRDAISQLRTWNSSVRRGVRTFNAIIADLADQLAEDLDLADLDRVLVEEGFDRDDIDEILGAMQAQIDALQQLGGDDAEADGELQREIAERSEQLGTQVEESSEGASGGYGELGSGRDAVDLGKKAGKAAAGYGLKKGAEAVIESQGGRAAVLARLGRFFEKAIGWFTELAG